MENISSDLNDTDNTDNKLFTSTKKRTGLKILTPRQILQRLPIALARVKAGNNSKSLLNEIRFFINCINRKKPPKKYKITYLNQYKYKKWILYL